MNPDPARIPRAVELANRLESDIRARGLLPGDSYLSAAAAARQLRASTSSANRALQILAQRGVIERRQRKGAIIASLPVRGPDSSLPRVSLIIPHAPSQEEASLYDQVMVGLHERLPLAELLLRPLDPHDPDGHVAQLVRPSSGPEGFVLVRSTLPAQRLMARSTHACVVFGGLFPSVEGLASIDRDHRQIGEALTTHLIGSGHRRIVAFMRERSLPGDHDFLDGTLAELSRAGFAPDALALRYSDSDERATRNIASELLEQPESPGFLCRSLSILRGVQAELAARGRSDSTLTLADLNLKPGWQPPAVAHVRPAISPEEGGRRLADMLLAQLGDAAGETPHERFPVEIVLP